MKRSGEASNQNSGSGSGDGGRLGVGKFYVTITDVSQDKTNNNGTPFFEATFRADNGAKLTSRVYLTAKSAWVLDRLIAACGYNPESIPVDVEVDQRVLVGSKIVLETEEGYKGYTNAKMYFPVDETVDLKPWPSVEPTAQQGPVNQQPPAQETNDDLPF